MKQSRLTLWGSLLILVGIILAAVYLLLIREEDKASDDSNDEAARVISPLKGTIFEPPLPVADFTFPSTQGEFTFTEERGKVLLFYFGYMTCPDFCPTTMAELTRVYRELTSEEQSKVQVVFFTVDPERDSVERMTTYLNAFNDDFVGVRAEQQNMYDVLNQFGVTAVKTEVDSALEYLVDHTVSVFMVDPDGWVITRYAYQTPFQDIVHDVRVVLES